MHEKWISIKGYENLYTISNTGKIKNKNNKLIKTKIGINGYEQVCLHNNSKVKYFLVHRLVALHFIKNNNECKSQVNHIDGNKLNNVVTNLEWVTPLYNTRHSIINGLTNNNKKIAQISRDNGKILRTFNSIKEAAIYTGSEKHNAHIIDCCKGRRNNAYGYMWKYLDTIK